MGSGKIWLSNVNCTEVKEYLHDCYSNDWGVTDCSHDDDVAVKCLPKHPQNG